MELLTGGLIPSKNQIGERRVIKKMKSKMVALFATLMIALMAVGFAYAHWSDTIRIVGSVETGTVAVAWTAKECYDNEVPPMQDIGKFECVFSEPKEDAHTGKTGFGLLTVTITDAYPCYKVTCLVGLTVIGTLPVHVKEVIVVGEITDKLNVDFSGVEVSNKLHPCSTTPCTLEIHVKQDASQCTTYTFSVTVVVEQAQ